MFTVLAKGLSASDETLTKSQFGQILGAITRKHAPKYFNAIAIPRGVAAVGMGAIGEGLEEGIDEYINTLIQAVATARDDLSFGELMAHTGTAAALWCNIWCRYAGGSTGLQPYLRCY